MKNYPAILALLAVLLPLAVQADTLEFDVPGLAGPSGDPPKTGSFVYVGPPVDVTAVRVRFTGTIYDRGLVQCSCPGQPQPPFPWWLDCGGPIYKKDAVEEGRWFGGDRIDQLGDFERTREYLGEWNGSAYVGFDQLEDGDVVEMNLDFCTSDEWQWFSPGDVCALLRESDGELFSVTVILDVTVQVPVKQTTWGRIKKLY